MRTFISKEEILKKTEGGLNIFTYFLSDMIVSGKGYITPNPFRDDQNPSFYVSKWEKTGLFYFRDWAFPDEYRGNCFELVARFEGLDCKKDFVKVLKICAEICSELGIKLDSAQGADQKIDFGRPIKATPILEGPATWNTQEYLKRLGLTTKRAIELGMIPVNQVNVEHDCGGFRTYSFPQTAFLFKGIGGAKCYRPKPKKFYQIELGQDYRFEVGDWQRAGMLVLCAGEKDAASFYNATNIPSMSLLSESVNLSQELEELIEESQVEVAVLYDNDEAGRKSAERLHNKYGFSIAQLHTIVPRRKRMKVKDVSDYIKEGLDKLKLRNLVLDTMPVSPDENAIRAAA